MIFFALISKVTPNIISTQLRHLPIDVRKCLYPEETRTLGHAWFRDTGPSSARFQSDFLHRMRMLSNFSVSGCLFECNIMVSFHSCECVPWQFPMFKATYESTCKSCNIYIGKMFTFQLLRCKLVQ